MNKEKIILGSLLRNPNFQSLALPFLKFDYFTDKIENTIIKVIALFVDKYNEAPSKSTLLYEATQGAMSDSDKAEIESYINELYQIDIPNDDWLKNEAELFCQEKAAYLAIMKAIDVYNGEEKKITPAMIPDLLRDAVNIAFDVKLGHDLMLDAENRYLYYTSPVAKVPFDLDILNLITDNGCTRKTLNIVLGGVNCGKTGFLCHLAAAYAKMGLNVLYVTLEMAEEEISKRMDANLMGLNVSDLKYLSKEKFMNKIKEIQSKGFGKVLVKQLESGVGHAGHIRHIMREADTKQGIKFDVVFVDYLGICASQKVAHGAVNTYSYQKYVAEELRNIGMAYDCVVWSGMQLNRQGMNSNDVTMTDIADSFAVAATSDFMLSIMRTEELDAVQKILCKQIKSRYGNKGDMLRFTIGVNQHTQQYYDVEQPNETRERIERASEVRENENVVMGQKTSTASRFAGMQ